MIRVSIKIDGVQISNHDLASVNLQQEIANHHHFEIKFRREQESHELAHYASKHIGSSVTIGFADAENEGIDSARIKDYFKGVITGVSVSSHQNGISMLIIRGTSPTIHMEDGWNCKTFLNMGAQEIVDKVCSSYSGKYSGGVEVRPSYSPTLEYTVQYKETNFEFLQRLAARFGDWLFYDGFKLHYGTRPKDETTDLSFGADALKSYELRVHAQPHKVNISTYDYWSNTSSASKAPSPNSSENYSDHSIKGSDRIFTERSAMSVERQTKDEIDEIAKRFHEQATEECVVLNGTSSNGNLTLGSYIHLTDQAHGEDHGMYIITRLSHFINQAGGYENEFEAYPSDMASPPLRSSGISPTCEPQIAEVVNVDDPESLGRIAVRFVWQEADGSQSPYIRVVTPYAATAGQSGYGFYFTPEVGESVLVAFENNNPDRPYVVGGMYHGKSVPEHYDAGNNIKGIKTRGEGELKFDDKQQITRVYAKKKLEFVAGEEIEIRTEEKGANSITLDVGKSGKVIIKAGEVIIESAKKVQVDSKGTVSMKATQNMNLSAMNTTVEGKTKSEIKGATVNVSGQAATVVKGGIIKLN